MTKTENTLSIVKEDLIITYGFYDAGSGIAGLPSQDQCWVGAAAQMFFSPAVIVPIQSFSSHRVQFDFESSKLSMNR